MAGAQDGALVIDENGRVIIWNYVGDANLLVKGDVTPAIRLEQDDSYYPAQIWDIAGDEHYFTILDVTGGQPFHKGILVLETGAPRNSLYVNDAGYIGLGTDDPLYPLHVKSGDDELAQLDSSGNLTLNGTPHRGLRPQVERELRDCGWWECAGADRGNAYHELEFYQR